MEKRLFIVSNRLPITIDDEKGILPSSGGLISAMTSYMQNSANQRFTTSYWAGVPGCSPGKWDEAIYDVHQGPFAYLPVFTNQEDYSGYYNGHANSTIWPLFHYFPSYAEYNLDNYEKYYNVNSDFLHTLIKHLRPNDTVWIHDYHLLPLAGMLRQEIPELTIGFFLHIPFPSYEVFRLMPRQWQEDVITGMLGADLVGFHTIDYAAHFLQSVQMITGLDHDQHVIRNKDRIIKVDVFPISIDYELFNNSYDNQEVTGIRNRLLKGANGQKIIFSIDRLDYTKGLNNRLKAYEYFLLKNPEYREKVLFLLVIIPSRDNIPKYVERKKMIDELISGINSRLGNLQWQPVIYQYCHLPFEEMLAYYTGCDLALITPLRDGMNLVAKEFVASRKDKKGVLIISEMAGAARELTDALLINPNDIEEMAQQIKSGLEMDLDDQNIRISNMQSRISNYNVAAWTEDFFNALENIKRKQSEFKVKALDDFSRRILLDTYRKAKKRLLILDYDGTLVPFTSRPSDAIPGSNLIEMLRTLSLENELYIVSGRSSAWLEKCFGTIGVNLIAEHGARTKIGWGSWVNEVLPRSEWKTGALQIMQSYVRRCANSSVEEKEYSLVWHYRNANADQGKLRASELYAELTDFAYNRHLEVMKGHKIVELRNSGIDKGAAIRKILSKGQHDFILAMGDDTTDEDMFKILAANKNSFTIKIGTDASYAKYNLYTPQMVISLLEQLAFIPVEDAIQ
jgi:trehalose 6-phosphate synthase/phosphatase